MSVAQFSPILRQKIFDIYSDSSNTIDLASFGKLTRKKLFKTAPDTKDIRTRFTAADYHTSSITLEGIDALTKRIVESIDENSTKETISNFFNDPNFFENFLQYLETKPNVLVSEYGSGDYRLKNIPQDNLKDFFMEYLEKNLKGMPKQVLSSIRKNIQSGHLASVFFLKLKVGLGIKTTFSTGAEASYRDFTVTMEGVDDTGALNYLDSIVKAVLDADFVTSNLITQQQVFIDATKSVLGDNPSLITELQFTQDNKAAGDLLQQTGKQLNKLINAASIGEKSSAEQAIKELVKTLKPVADMLLQKVEELKEPLSQQGLYNPIKKNAENLLNNLINAPGSVPLIKGIAKNISNNILTGKSLKPSISKIKPKPITQKIKKKIDIGQVAKKFEKAAKQLKKAINKNKVPNKIGIKGQKGNFATVQELSSLQNIINSLLHQQIRQNMGTGTSTNVLNYQTGRFAESARVERITQGREGMISAYYTYMKYPYATFSEGGRQEFPRSRDPKLLISKSIREIMQQQMITRMRAVLI